MRYAKALGMMLLVVSLVAGVALANGGIYLGWSVIGGGGGTSSGGGYALEATIGQPVVSTSAGGRYELCAGYWCGASPGYHLYLPTMKKKS